MIRPLYEKMFQSCSDLQIIVYEKIFESCSDLQILGGSFEVFFSSNVCLQLNGPNSGSVCFQGKHASCSCYAFRIPIYTLV